MYKFDVELLKVNRDESGMNSGDIYTVKAHTPTDAVRNLLQDLYNEYDPDTNGYKELQRVYEAKCSDDEDGTIVIAYPLGGMVWEFHIFDGLLQSERYFKWQFGRKFDDKTA